jgi:chromosome partitioning protein
LEPGENIPQWSAGIRAIPAAYLVLDSPPHLDAVLGGVIGLSDIAVIPCGPSGLDLIATAETVGLVREIRKARGGKLPLIVLVPTRVDRRTMSGRQLEGALEDLGELVSPPLHSRTALADAFNLGEWVGTYAPGSDAHAEVKELATFVLKAIKPAKGKTKE